MRVLSKHLLLLKVYLLLQVSLLLSKLLDSVLVLVDCILVIFFVVTRRPEGNLSVIVFVVVEQIVSVVVPGAEMAVVSDSRVLAHLKAVADYC